MWFEILPSFGIVLGALALPGIANYYCNKFMLGNAYKRNLDLPDYRNMYRRDFRLTGQPYKPAGLENIPDQ